MEIRVRLCTVNFVDSCKISLAALTLSMPVRRSVEARCRSEVSRPSFRDAPGPHSVD